ncbi:hypothetical protein R2601_02828 [Salipiger bermudensis HTCC2601]|uniref:Uncharacterized protein n=1 Tax=Salipiger bermudensis (strain DSM 26914 / JCM 13377 / KCTC 12554 / HTCC2601) TaxID=314265 RepID=Q0FWT0_SALBH|nr:hypothetical protein R2601_02828 [Salipiger bermudensis HTCC2601]
MREKYTPSAWRLLATTMVCAVIPGQSQ